MACTARKQKGLPAVRRGTLKGEFFVESQSVTFMEWRVLRDYMGNLTCKGNSEGGRCWKFSAVAHCKHTAATEKYLAEKAGRAAVAMTPAQRSLAEGGSVADLFDTSRPPFEDVA